MRRTEETGPDAARPQYGLGQGACRSLALGPSHMDHGQFVQLRPREAGAQVETFGGRTAGVVGAVLPCGGAVLCADIRCEQIEGGEGVLRQTRRVILVVCKRCHFSLYFIGTGGHLLHTFAQTYLAFPFHSNCV